MENYDPENAYQSLKRQILNLGYYARANQVEDIGDVETEITSSYKQLSVFINLNPTNHKESIYLSFIFWPHSVVVALVSSFPVISEGLGAPYYQETALRILNPDPNHPKLLDLDGWASWAHQEIQTSLSMSA